MKFIATQVDDSPQKMAEMLELERSKQGFGLSAYFYRSHLVYEHELSSLVFKSWLYACHVSEIPNAGDFLQFEVGEDAAIIVRDGSGDVHALINVCRHRGARVCEKQSGNCKTFVCPYHGWVYNTDGSLRAAREMSALEGFESVNYGLKKARVEIFMGLVFVNFDPDADDFRGPLENLREPLQAYDLENAKVAHKQTYRVDANWKLCVENYMECYHCATAHRAYARMHSISKTPEQVRDIVEKMLAGAEEKTGVAGITKYYNKTYLDAEGMGTCAYTSRYGLFDGHLTGSEDGQPVAPLLGKMQDYDGGVSDFQIGPLGAMLIYPDHGVLYRFIPRGLTATDMQVVWFVRGDAQEGVDYDLEKLTWLWHRTSLEDEYIITRNSEGVNSHFFEPGPYHPEFEDAVIGFINWYLHNLEQAA